jgi:hypothetical protein
MLTTEALATLSDPFAALSQASKGHHTKKSGQAEWFVGYKKHTLHLLFLNINIINESRLAQKNRRSDERVFFLDDGNRLKGRAIHTRNVIDLDGFFWGQHFAK